MPLSEIISFGGNLQIGCILRTQYCHVSQLACCDTVHGLRHPKKRTPSLIISVVLLQSSDNVIYKARNFKAWDTTMKTTPIMKLNVVVTTDAAVSLYIEPKLPILQ